MYMNCLENLGNKFPLLKAAYLQSRINFDNNKPSWYGSMSKILEKLGTDRKFLTQKPSTFKKSCKALIKSMYFSEWEKLWN